MVKKLLALLFAASLSFGMIAGCQDSAEDNAEDAVDNVQDAAEDAGDAIKEGAEEAGDAVEDATGSGTN